MLAPRKTLWSTPAEAIERAIELLNISADDVVFDVGCGDGRFLIRCHELTSARCIGVEIDSERANDAVANISAIGYDESCMIVNKNALEYDYSDGTVFFLYLIPRGLKLMLPILRGQYFSIFDFFNYMGLE